MQLPLNIRLSDAFCFANFFGDQNQELIASLKAAVHSLTEPSTSHLESITVWGRSGVGKTHILQSACQLARALELESVYLPLGEPGLEAPSMLEGLDRLPLVCIDNLQLVAGQSEWETGLFNLYENIKHHGLLLSSSISPPSDTGYQLPDLVSRFNRGLVYPIHSLDHSERLQVIRQRARLRGLEIGDDVAAFIEKHYPRDLASLVRLLEQLDQESLIQQRRITIPFIKSLTG